MRIDKRSQVGFKPPPTTHQQLYSQVSSLQYPLSPSPSGSHGLSEAYREMSTEANVCGIDFESRVEIELQRAIEEQYVQANTLLKSVLFSQSYLLWHLRGMGEFYFMLQGSAMHWFSVAMFSKVRYLPLCIVERIPQTTYNSHAFENDLCRCKGGVPGATTIFSARRSTRSHQNATGLSSSLSRSESRIRRTLNPSLEGTP